MVSVQVRHRSLPLVPIWVALSALPAGEPLRKIQGSPRCGIPLGRFGTPQPKTSAPVSSLPIQLLGCCTSDIMHWMRTATSWWLWLLSAVKWLAGVRSNCQGSNYLSYINNCFWLTRYHPAVAYMFLTVLNCLFEHGLQKYSILWFVSAEPVFMGG